MRIILFICFVFVFNIGFSQSIIEKEIMSFMSLEKNPKKISVSLLMKKDLKSIVFNAYNIKSQKVQSCIWTSKIKFSNAFNFFDNLSSSVIAHEKGSKIKIKEGLFYTIKHNRDKIKISFHQSKCERDHKIGYFQKDCNRVFSFSVETHVLSELIAVFEDNVNLVSEDFVFKK
tara:strand:- start:1822 stop:2340 length:519 start_codon:yes stop_codon:yes gene_type:complete